MLTYPWKCTVVHCHHLGNTRKPLVLITRHFDYCPSANEGDNQSVRSSAPMVSRCFPGGYNVKLYISRGRLAWWLLAFLHSVILIKWSIIGTCYNLSLSNISSIVPPDGDCNWMNQRAFCEHKLRAGKQELTNHHSLPCRFIHPGFCIHTLKSYNLVRLRITVWH